MKKIILWALFLPFYIFLGLYGLLAVLEVCDKDKWIATALLFKAFHADMEA